MPLSQNFIDTIPREHQPLLPRSWEVIGDVAITQIVSQLQAYQRLIGREIMSTNKRIRAVLNKTARHAGAHRTASFFHLAGEMKTETVHKEYGVSLLLDPCRVYFSARSASERHRIVSLVADNESVLVPFSGIAPYPLLIEKHTGAKRLTAIEHNPDACYYAKKNLLLNHATRIELINSDFSRIAKKFHNTYQRVIMPLPVNGSTYLGPGASAIKQQGMIHLYTFTRKSQVLQLADRLKNTLSKYDWQVITIAPTVCGHPAPRLFKVCFDIHIKKAPFP